MQKVVQEFIAKHWDRKRPLLLGCSGGPDSKALLYALKGVDFHVAHVNHGWCQEEEEEAQRLQREVEALGRPFHCMRLPHKVSEDGARKSRLSYFRTLLEELGAQAVLLGHHADELAETVLKRLFEGAHLTALTSMRPISVVDGVCLWRPFLGVRKSEILTWLNSQSIEAFCDPANADPTYLRPRLRHDLLPKLEEISGKKISQNLCLLSERSSELEEYLAFRTKERKVSYGLMGTYLDCTGLPRMEARYLLQKLAKEEGLTLTRDVLETILDWLSQNKPRSIEQNGHKMFINRGIFSIQKVKTPKTSKEIS